MLPEDLTIEQCESCISLIDDFLYEGMRIIVMDKARLNPLQARGFVAVTEETETRLIKTTKNLANQTISALEEQLKSIGPITKINGTQAKLNKLNKTMTKGLKAQAKAYSKLVPATLKKELISASGLTRIALGKEHDFDPGDIPKDLDKKIQRISAQSKMFVNERYSNILPAASTAFLVNTFEHLGANDASEKILARMTTIAKSTDYWKQTSVLTQNSNRSLNSLYAFNQIGVVQYQIDTVNDRRRSEICAKLDGLVFTVNDGLANFDKMLSANTIEAFRDAVPMLLPASKGNLQFKSKGKTTRFNPKTIGGKFMADNGLMFPPYHGLCRSVLIIV